MDHGVHYAVQAAMIIIADESHGDDTKELSLAEYR